MTGTEIWPEELDAVVASAQHHKLLFENGVVADHLVTNKKSLEQMFLEIVSEANH